MFCFSQIHLIFVALWLSDFPCSKYQKLTHFYWTFLWNCFLVNFTSIKFDYISMQWVTNNYASNPGFLTCVLYWEILCSVILFCVQFHGSCVPNTLGQRFIRKEVVCYTCERNNFLFKNNVAAVRSCKNLLCSAYLCSRYCMDMLVCCIGDWKGDVFSFQSQNRSFEYNLENIFKFDVKSLEH